MPLAREQRVRLARVLAWSRSHGWTHDGYPNTWRSADGQIHVRYDTTDGPALVVSAMTPGQDPLRCSVALIPVPSPGVALDVLAALGHLPAGLGSLLLPVAGDLTPGVARELYRALMRRDRDQHAYMSTYCQHGLHADCRQTCKCCGALCICQDCSHTEPALTADPLEHDGVDPWRYDDTDREPLDGPSSFIEAGQAFADLVDGRISAERAAEVLSTLARHGLIVSVAYHDDTTAEPPEQLALFDLADLADHLDRTGR